MLDIFSPQISVVSKDMAGKSWITYGSNRTGKSKQACNFPKPCYLAFEAGLAGIPGVPFFPMRTWRDYTDFVKQITDPKNLERAKEMYQTIIIDQIEAMGDACAQYICSKFGVSALGEKKKTASGKEDFSFNGYKELDKENQKWQRLLLLSGFSVHYIGHATTQEITDENGETYAKIQPKGDKRIVSAICDAVDMIIYVYPNGIDKDTGEEILSSALLANTTRALAGSRIDYMPPILKEYTAENLTKAVADAIAKQEEITGNKAVSFAEQTAMYEDKEVHLPIEELKSTIGALAVKMNEQGHGQDYYNIVDECWGDHTTHRVSEAKEINREALEMILGDIRRLGFDN